MHCKSEVAGSIPAIPIPVNCHYRKAFPKCSNLPSDWFRWFTLGDDAWFKSTRRTFLFLVVTLWKKIIVAHANGMHWKKAYAVMVKANVVQISDIWMTVVNVGRVLKMTKQEAKKMKKELSDYKKVFSELEERCSPEALEYADSCSGSCE